MTPTLCESASEYASGKRSAARQDQRAGSRLVARTGCIRAARADAADPTVSIRVAVAGEQVSTDVAMALRPRRIVAVRQMPGHRLQTASRIELLPGVNDCPPT